MGGFHPAAASRRHAPRQRAGLGFVEHLLDLLSPHGRKLFDEVVDGAAALQVVKNDSTGTRLFWHARSRHIVRRERDRIRERSASILGDCGHGDSLRCVGLD